MSDPKVAVEFFNKHLPAKIKNIVDLNSIRLEKSSFIDDKLKQQSADLLFQTKFNSKPGYLYLLLEHQSQVEKLMPFRILKYMVAIIDQHLNKTKKEILPVVYPMVFYSGGKKYNYSTDLFDLFGTERKLAIDILYKPYPLIDLSQIPDAELEHNMQYGILAMVMKHAHDRKVTEFLKGFLKKLAPIKNNPEFGCIYEMLSYIIEVYDVTEDEFADIVRENLPIINERDIMSIAETYWQRGLNEGRQEGIQTGRREGVQKGETKALENVTIALRLFNQGQSIEQVSIITGLTIEQIKLLKEALENSVVQE